MTPLGHRHLSLTTPTTPASVPLARHAARVALCTWDVAADEPAAETTLLVVTELVTNSVLHARKTSPHVDVNLTSDRETFALEVHDRHPCCPVPLMQARAEGSGWGLRMIEDIVATSGGTSQTLPDADGKGKTIRVVLPRG